MLIRRATKIKRNKQTDLEETGDELETDVEEGADRLSSLPDDLLIRILSFLDTKQAVQLSLSLKKKWVTLWTLIPDLDFDTNSFDCLDSLHRFVHKVLAIRDDTVMINKFSYRGYVYRSKSQMILEPQAGSDDPSKTWKLCCFESDFSLCIKQLVCLHLEKVQLNGIENFSSCPNLKTLTLISCHFWSKDASVTFNLVAPQLSTLTISSVYDERLIIVLLTPRMTSFMMEGGECVPLVQTKDELAYLEAVNIDFNFCFVYEGKIWRKDLFRRLFSMMKCFSNAKSLMLSFDIVQILSEFPDVLERETSPFCNLKTLNVVSYDLHTVSIPGHVMKYLIGRSPDAINLSDF